MIKSITVTNHLGDSIKLELVKPEESGFLIKHIDGLGPVKASINTTKVAMSDGVSYNSSYLQQRDITLSLLFIQTATESIEDLRHKSYRYFPINKRIELTIETDKRTSKTSGIVETNEPDIFSDAEGCSIVLLCDDPLFYSVTNSETVVSGVRPTFTFPFSNESLSQPLLQMGSIETKTAATVYYKGDYEVGLTMVIHAIGEASNVTIYNLTTNEQMCINTDRLVKLTGSGIVTGDTITIDTQKKKKSITLFREGKEVNILNCLDKGTKWFTLMRGDNVFAYTADTGAKDLQFRILNKVAYEGV